MTNDLDKARRKKAQRQLVDQTLESLFNVPAEEAKNLLASVAEASDSEISTAMLEAMHRQEAYRQVNLKHAQEDELEGIPADLCCNQVCRDNVEKEGKPFCGQGVLRAQDCMFRMSEPPPRDPFSRLPSHAEALRLLQREGLMKPDEFGHWNGTDFAFRKQSEKLWWAYVKLLVETGKIPTFPFEEGRHELIEDAYVELGLLSKGSCFDDLHLVQARPEVVSEVTEKARARKHRLQAHVDAFLNSVVPSLKQGELWEHEDAVCALFKILFEVNPIVFWNSAVPFLSVQYADLGKVRRVVRVLCRKLEEDSRLEECSDEF